MQIPNINSSDDREVPVWIVAPDLESSPDDNGCIGVCDSNIAPCPPPNAVINPIHFAGPKDDVMQVPGTNPAVPVWIVAPDLESSPDDNGCIGVCDSNIAPCPPPVYVTSPIHFAGAKDNVMQVPGTVPVWIVAPDLESPPDDSGCTSVCSSNIAPCPPPVAVYGPMHFAGPKDGVMQVLDTNPDVPTSPAPTTE